MNTNKDVLYPTAAANARRREEVLLGMWEGKSVKEIGADLGISSKTVEYHRAQLYRVLGVRDPVSLCRRAMVMGLIKPPHAETVGKIQPSGSKLHRSSKIQALGNH